MRSKDKASSTAVKEALDEFADTIREHWRGKGLGAPSHRVSIECEELQKVTTISMDTTLGELADIYKEWSKLMGLKARAD